MVIRITFAENKLENENRRKMYYEKTMERSHIGGCIGTCPCRLAEGNSYSIRGGTGYGVSLLYETVKNLL